MRVLRPRFVLRRPALGLLLFTGIFALSACGKSCGGAPEEPTKSSSAVEPSGPPQTITSKMNLRTVWGTGAGDVWVGGDDGVLLHSDGKTWTKIPSGTTESVTSIYGLGPADVWASTQQGSILHYDGKAWTKAHHEESASLLGIWASGPEDVWAAGTKDNGEAGFVYRWNGKTWAPQGIPGASALWGISGSGPTDVWFIGSSEQGTGLVMRGNGKLFDLVGYKGASARGIWCKSPSDVWIAPYTGALQHYDGKAWTEAAGTAEAAPLFRLAGTSPDTGWGVGSNGHALRFASGAWTTASLGTDGLLWSVWGDSPTDAWAVGNEGLVRHWNGSTWQNGR